MSGYSPILELGDDPITPREKVARAIQAHDNDHVPDGYANGLSDEVSDWSAYLADRVLTALASGSGDHAELVRLAEAVRIFKQIEEHHGIECIPDNEIQAAIRTFLSKEAERG